METANSAEDVTARRHYAGDGHFATPESTISGMCVLGLVSLTWRPVRDPGWPEGLIDSA